MQKLLTMLVVFVGLMINADKSFGEKIEIDIDKFMSILTNRVDTTLINDATQKATNKDTINHIIDSLKPNIKEYLNDDDAEKVSSNLKELLSTMLKDISHADIASVMKMEIVKSFLNKAINDALKINILDKQIEELAEKVDMLNAGIKPKIIRPNKEVDFLYEAIIGDSYKPKNLLYNGQSILKIEPGFFSTKMTTNQTKDIKLTDSEAINYEMLAVEEVLGLGNHENEEIIERIKRAQKKIRNYDWERDHLRFALMASYVNDIDAIATSLILHAYPSYRRFIPGKPDPLRRISFFFGLGTSGTNIKDSDIEGPIYSYGLGFDIREGIGLTVGGSTYTIKDSTNDSEDVKTNWTAGVTLTSELWKAFFNGK